MLKMPIISDLLLATFCAFYARSLPRKIANGARAVFRWFILIPLWTFRGLRDDYLCYRRNLPDAKRKYELELWKSQAAEPLPAVRARALTMPFTPLAGQRTKDQSHAPLLTKLPWELRVMIYQEVLGGHVLFILNKQKGLWCLTDDMDSDVACQWRSVFDTDRLKGRHNWTKLPPGCLLSLALTCRQVYGYGPIALALRLKIFS